MHATTTPRGSRSRRRAPEGRAPVLRRAFVGARTRGRGPFGLERQGVPMPGLRPRGSREDATRRDHPSRRAGAAPPLARRVLAPGAPPNEAVIGMPPRELAAVMWRDGATWHGRLHDARGTVVTARSRSACLDKMRRAAGNATLTVELVP